MEQLTEGQIRYRKYRDTYTAYRLRNKSLRKKNPYMPDMAKIYYDNHHFGGNKIKALERDGYKCQKCGMTNEEHNKKWGRDITVDHIDGNGRYSKTQNNDLENLVTLCLSCHGKKDIVRRRLFKDYSEAGKQKLWSNLLLSSRRRGITKTTKE